MDLFADQIGADFADVTSFSNSVGGTPANIAIATSRLGLKSAIFTAVGHDQVANFVRQYLAKEGVDTRYIANKQGRTGLAIVAVQPPSTFPVTLYRENPADIYFDVVDVDVEALAGARVLLVSGTALARANCRVASFYACQFSQNYPTKVFMDLDLRPDQWQHPQDYSRSLQAILPFVDVAIGTEEESYAALIANEQESSTTAIHDLSPEQILTLERYLEHYLQQPNSPNTWILKRGAKGISIYQNSRSHDIPAFPITPLNTVGAGDGFASGLIYSYLQGKTWQEAGRFANACGAIVVSRHGCSVAMPYLEEVEKFLAG